MMEQLKQTILLFCILTISNLTSLNKAWAQHSQLQQQLIEINQRVDKKQALLALSQLINSPALSAADKVAILLQQSKILFTLHRYNQGIDVVQRARDTATKAGLSNLAAQADKMLGVLLYYQGELKSALKAYQASLAYYDDNQESDLNTFAIERANLLNNIALVYTSLGQPNLALVNYQLAEPLYAHYGDEVDKVDVRYNIAALHISLKRFDSAIDMLIVIIEKRQQLKDDYGVAQARADLGVAYKDSGQFELGVENILSALRFFQAHGYKHDIASQLHNMSEIYNDIFDIEQALYYGKQALAISKEVGHQKAYAGSLQSLAKASFYSGDIAQAELYIERSINVGEKIDYQALLTENLAISALIYASKQDFVQALVQQQKYQYRYLLASNNLLNHKLAEFESVQLNQKIVDLEQRRRLQNLQSAKIEQQRNLIILGLVLVLVVIFFIYRRYLEKRLTQELEFRVKQRTRELENLTDELAQANQVKSQFLANMSHEIRTPLTAIVGHAEAIIHDDIDKSKVQEDIEVIHGNSLHLLELINDILDLSRIEANKFELEIQPVDLAELIQDLSHTFTSQAEQKQLRFTIEHQLSLPFIIQVDNLRLKQILLNLCANAIKFTEKGHVKLNISWQSGQLAFTVTDTGIGLSTDHLAQIFEIFTQADNSISRRFGGSGLGLSLSNQLAKLMSGNIAVTSKLGRGSSFCLTLPCQHNADKSNIVKENIKVIDDALLIHSSEDLFSGQVLLAEDHDDNRRLIARLLRSLGLEVIVASNGKEAVELWLEHQPKLILLDIQMPEMDGVEAFKALRALGCKQAIYALTANAMSHEVSQYLSIGFTGHLKKPIERKNFIATIAKYFNTNNALSSSTHRRNDGPGKVLSANELFDKAEENIAQVDLSDLVAEFKINLSNDKRALLLFSDNNEIEKLAYLSHRLAGAAQMFGFNELNQAAKELEVIIKKELGTDKPNHLSINELAHCLVDEINVIEQQ
ncbi:ATP-binding protein [Colwellia psychrerythraea]|uniref:histidine kinase n=1 Tax=Colwellia psychrerythraea TaxID=28229 RepID=A0A099KNQ4_COLPS|nr:ATP-binding protein [Colwellia psychrerythraea]KGJ91268.1 TPR sensor domain hybrid histidine kinase [Colwellia psychrerythraea]